ncbi:MAG: radical SAM family heme chaperone HemW [Acidobacteria bacterium]|nr:radical SAM family heme chaperone HemW [Acidobacteriota bacterium]
MAGVYLSFPFCAQKCTYCNFASGVFPSDLEERYLDALGNEIRAHQWRWTPETVYIGGGSPSRLEVEKLAGLLEMVPGRPWKEATIEAAPGEIDARKTAGWREAGISRVSLGVQSFVQNELSRTGRRHTAHTVAADVRMLREHAIENINLDLIAGLPHQNIASFAESLDWIERLDVPHVSVYMLEVDQDSRLGRELLDSGSKYGASSVPSEDEIVAMYQFAVERLAHLGIYRYEISNFARPGSESLHNLKYWRLDPYIGFGADAHSHDAGVRWRNAGTAAAYVARSERGRTVVADRTFAIPQEEKFFVGLRLAGGVHLEPAEWERFEAPIVRFLDQGLLEREGDMLRFTGQGILYSNEVLQEFIHA